VYQLDTLSNENMLAVEADTFWCMSHFLAHIQDNFVISNTGIEAMINKMVLDTHRTHGDTPHQHNKGPSLTQYPDRRNWCVSTTSRCTDTSSPSVSTS
jgi:hypothetical protein